MRLYNILKSLRLDRILGPGWPDHARFLVQKPTLVEMTNDLRMEGKCLNAGCGQGLYSSFLESRTGVSQIANVDVNVHEQIFTGSLPEYSGPVLPYRQAVGPGNPGETRRIIQRNSVSTYAAALTQHRWLHRMLASRGNRFLLHAIRINRFEMVYLPKCF
jgi:hypothetical protein